MWLDFAALQEGSMATDIQLQDLNCGHKCHLVANKSLKIPLRRDLLLQTGLGKIFISQEGSQIAHKFLKAVMYKEKPNPPPPPTSHIPKLPGAFQVPYFFHKYFQHYFLSFLT